MHVHVQGEMLKKLGGARTASQILPLPMELRQSSLKGSLAIGGSDGRGTNDSNLR